MHGCSKQGGSRPWLCRHGFTGSAACRAGALKCPQTGRPPQGAARAGAVRKAARRLPEAVCVLSAARRRWLLLHLAALTRHAPAACAAAAAAAAAQPRHPPLQKYRTPGAGRAWLGAAVAVVAEVVLLLARSLSSQLAAAAAASAAVHCMAAGSAQVPQGLRLATVPTAAAAAAWVTAGGKLEQRGFFSE